MVTQRSGNLTLTEIARLAGVGLGTASRALSGAPGVAAATRERVLRVARDHDYVASPEATRLRSKTRGRVAVVVPHLSRWFFGAMLEGIEGVLREAQIDVMLYHVGDLEDRRQFFERLPARRKVDAVVVVGFPVEEKERERLDLLGAHIVAAGGQQATYPHVSINDLTAGRQAVDHLLSLGHRRVAMIEAVDPDQPFEPSGRSQAYREALSAAGIQVDPELVVTCDWGGEEGAAAMGELLSRSIGPTAVYAHSDEVALGAIRTLRRAGLRVPEDVSVVGIDDHPLAALVDLTTVRQPVLEQGQTAARMVLQLLDGQTPPSVTTTTRLVVRGTTHPPTG